MEMGKLLLDPVINCDQTAVHNVSGDNWTMAREGSKQVEIIGKDEKCLIKVVLGGTMSRDFHHCNWCTRGQQIITFSHSSFQVTMT